MNEELKRLVERLRAIVFNGGDDPYPPTVMNLLGECLEALLRQQPASQQNAARQNSVSARTEGDQSSPPNQPAGAAPAGVPEDNKDEMREADTWAAIKA